MRFIERQPFTEEEKQLILKIQSDDFISKCKTFFADKEINVNKVRKLDLNEGKNLYCSTVVWIFTSMGRFDISYNLYCYGGMGILNSKISKDFWKYYKNIIE